MPKYTDDKGTINLKDYKQVKQFTTGNTNRVYLWEHKDDSTLQIVVKIPYGNPDLIQHNIRSINAFFGGDSAWPISGTIDGNQAFAMKYYQGKPLSALEKENLISNKSSPLRTISKNGLLFTMLDPNEDNFLKLPTGEIIPIDHDYMIIHDGGELLPYQTLFLQGRMGFAKRQGDCTTEEAAEYVLDTYPAAAPYLYEIWGKEHLKTDKYAQSPDFVAKPIEEDSFKLEMTKSKSSQPGFFGASPKQEQPEIFEEHVKTTLSENQLRAVNQLIGQLQNEYASCWPYPNKPLKLEKIGALNAFIEQAETLPVAEAVQWVKDNYPNALQGRISTRTADLLKTLSHENNFALSI